MRRLAWLLLLLLAPRPAGAAEAALASQARATLERATACLRTISTHGGYAGIYSLDLRQRYGEALYHRAGADDIWVQPPGTPSVGQAFLRAYRATGDQRFLEAARETAQALVWGQRREGGWDYLASMSGFRASPSAPPRPSGACTFDDNVTQGALRFLMSLDELVDAPWLTQAVTAGLSCLLRSQFPNGAWPQRYPLGGGYADCYTFNDSAINDCLYTLLAAHRQYGKAEYLQGARRGGDFIILSQLPAPQAGWAQQYSRDLRPAWARKFEPPAVCASVTSHNIRTLVDLYLYTRDAKYLAPIPAAISWLNRSQIAEGRWARLYELGTNRPLYGDRDGKVHYTLEEISEERRRGYSWQGEYGLKGIRCYQQLTEQGADRFQAERDRLPSDQDRARHAAELVPRVREIIQAQDAQGRWITDGMLHIRAFVDNMNRLCEYLEAAR